METRVAQPYTTVFPGLSGKSVHHSTDEPELQGLETKGIQ